MMKRKPDLFPILTSLLALGVVASMFLLEATPDNNDKTATGFAQRSEPAPRVSSR